MNEMEQLKSELQAHSYEARIANGDCFDIDQDGRTHYLSKEEAKGLVAAGGYALSLAEFAYKKPGHIASSYHFPTAEQLEEFNLFNCVAFDFHWRSLAKHGVAATMWLVTVEEVKEESRQAVVDEFNRRIERGDRKLIAGFFESGGVFPLTTDTIEDYLTQLLGKQFGDPPPNMEDRITKWRQWELTMQRARDIEHNAAAFFVTLPDHTCGDLAAISRAERLGVSDCRACELGIPHPRPDSEMERENQQGKADAQHETIIEAGQKTFDVHLFPVVRLKICGIKANDMKAAIETAEGLVDYQELFARAGRLLTFPSVPPHELEFSDDVLEYLVDIPGEDTSENSRWFSGTNKTELKAEQCSQCERDPALIRDAFTSIKNRALASVKAIEPEPELFLDRDEEFSWLAKVAEKYAALKEEFQQIADLAEHALTGKVQS